MQGGVGPILEDGGLCEYVSREEAQKAGKGDAAIVNRVKVSKGKAERSKSRCRLVAQELGHSEMSDEVFARTPALLVVKMLLHKLWKGKDEVGLMILDVKCAFLCGYMRRNKYIE